MCCKIDFFYTKETLEKLKKNKITITGYKVVNRIGETSVKGYQYYPGTHQMSEAKRVTIDNYNQYDPRGFHFYTSLKAAQQDKAVASRRRHILKVSVPVVDIIGLQFPGTSYEQGVSNSLFISTAEWKKAGLKLATTKS